MIRKNKLLSFLYCYFYIFITFSIGISVLPFVVSFLSFISFNSELNFFLPLKYYISMAIMAFFTSIVYLWEIGFFKR